MPSDFLRPGWEILCLLSWFWFTETGPENQPLLMLAAALPSCIWFNGPGLNPVLNVTSYNLISFHLGTLNLIPPLLFQSVSARLVNTKSNAASHCHLLCSLIPCARSGESSACSLDSDLLNPAREINHCLCWLLPCSLASDLMGPAWEIYRMLTWSLTCSLAPDSLAPAAKSTACSVDYDFNRVLCFPGDAPRTLC